MGRKIGNCGSCNDYVRNRCDEPRAKHYGEFRWANDDGCELFTQEAYEPQTAVPAVPAVPAGVQLSSEVAGAVVKMTEQLRAMADMVRITNERMTEMEKIIRTLEKVTPDQAKQINAAIRERAKEACAEYRAAGREKDAAKAIRRSVRMMTGVRSAKEIPRCDYGTVIEAVRDWDDYQEMARIRVARKAVTEG